MDSSKVKSRHLGDAERWDAGASGLHSHAERGNEEKERGCEKNRLFFCIVPKSINDLVGNRYSQAVVLPDKDIDSAIILGNLEQVVEW